MSAAPKYEAELSLAFSIAAEAGKMILEGSKKRWAAASASKDTGASGKEPGTKKNSVDVRTLSDACCGTQADGPN